MLSRMLGAFAAAAVLFAAPAAARTEIVTVHGASLEGNLEGNSADRQVYVYLPPSYDSSPNKRYPVVYFLHGYSVGATQYEGLAKFQEAVDSAAAAGNEVIVVMPDVLTKFKGAMFSPSVTTGDFVRFTAVDLVSYVDGHYRTLAKPGSRGLSGHSMGGFGTFRVAQSYPGVFSSIYTMAPCCLSPGSITADQLQTVAALTPDGIDKATGFALASPAQLSAWAPDPKNPPFYISTSVKDGAVDPLLLARLHANSPLVLLPQYVPAFKALRAIRLEVGDKDFLLNDDTMMHNELDRFGIAHEWKVFDGDHGNRVHDRIRSELLPFFAAHLDK